MTEFKWGYDYERFASRVTRSYRYRLDAEGENFLQTVLDTSTRRRRELPKGTRVWRAQLGAQPPVSEEREDGSVDIQYRALALERMKPLADSATEGRVNPKGIPVLYVATTPDTAMCEVRPSLASDISLAELQLDRALTLVDCTVASGRSIFSYAGRQVPAAEREEVVWHSINDAFTRPVDSSDRLADYAPTQVIAEAFRRAGIDGIIYRSGFGGGGHNIALFSLNDASALNVKLMHAVAVNFTFAD
jgi:RES domain-containing protein